MPFCVAQFLLDTEGSYGHPLIKLDAFTDNSRFSDDDTGTMVNKERRINGSLGMDIYPHL